jgi:hypothetical protein
VFRNDELRGVLLRLLGSVVTVGSVGVLVVVSDLTVWSLSPAAAVVGGVFAIVASVAEHVEPLRTVFERGQRLVTPAGVLWIFLFIFGIIPSGIFFGATAGFGVGNLVGVALALSVSGGRHDAAGG